MQNVKGRRPKILRPINYKSMASIDYLNSYSRYFYCFFSSSSSSSSSSSVNFFAIVNLQPFNSVNSAMLLIDVIY